MPHTVTGSGFMWISLMSAHAYKQFTKKKINQQVYPSNSSPDSSRYT